MTTARYTRHGRARALLTCCDDREPKRIARPAVLPAAARMLWPTAGRSSWTRRRRRGSVLMARKNADNGIASPRSRKPILYDPLVPRVPAANIVGDDLDDASGETSRRSRGPVVRVRVDFPRVASAVARSKPGSARSVSANLLIFGHFHPSPLGLLTLSRRRRETVGSSVNRETPSRLLRCSDVSNGSYFL